MHYTHKTWGLKILRHYFSLKSESFHRTLGQGRWKGGVVEGQREGSGKPYNHKGSHGWEHQCFIAERQIFSTVHHQVFLQHDYFAVYVSLLSPVLVYYSFWYLPPGGSDSWASSDAGRRNILILNCDSYWQVALVVLPQNVYCCAQEERDGLDRSHNLVLH